jgi:hypothetical protein
VRKIAAAAFVCALVAAGTAAAATEPVPAAVQARIAKQTPQLAYVPARGVLPYRYRSWKLAAGVLRIWFANANEPKKLYVFEVRVFHGTCRAGMQQSFQMAGVKAFYAYDGTRQQAWRCVHGTKLTAWTTIGLRKFSGAGLARIVASGHRIR